MAEINFYNRMGGGARVESRTQNKTFETTDRTLVGEQLLPTEGRTAFRQQRSDVGVTSTRLVQQAQAILMLCVSTSHFLAQITGHVRICDGLQPRLHNFSLST
jgi:hypothetical protein